MSKYENVLSMSLRTETTDRGMAASSKKCRSSGDRSDEREGVRGAQGRADADYQE